MFNIFLRDISLFSPISFSGYRVILDMMGIQPENVEPLELHKEIRI